jgi:hypothetical protein
MVRVDLRTVLVASTVGALASCTTTTTQGDRAFAARDFVAARASYQRVLAASPASGDRDAIRFRLGLLSLLPESPVHDAATGRALLAELASARSASGYRDAAVFFLDLQTAFETAETAADACAAEITRLEGEVKAQENTGKAREDAVQRLRASLADTQAQVHRLEEELRQLKDIDLRRKR